MKWWQEKADAELFKLLNSLPPFPFYDLIRQNKAELKQIKNTFFKTAVPPNFSYQKATLFNAERYQLEIDNRLLQIKTLNYPALLKDLYQDKLLDLRVRAKIVSAIGRGDDQTVTDLSNLLFNFPEEDLGTLTSEFEEMLEHSGIFHQHSRPITTELFVKMTEAVLDHYKMNKWRIELFNGSSIKIRHLNKSGTSTVYLPGKRNLSRARAARLLTHELEVHGLRTMNGRQSVYALFGRGLDHYLQTEEGLAVYYQTLLGKKTAKHLPGFWDAYAVALARNTDFNTTFKTLVEARMKLAQKTGVLKPEEVCWTEAWNLCVRVYRGITNTQNEHMVFARDHIYRSGVALLNKTITERSESVLPLLFSGKVGVHHLDKLIALNVQAGKVPDMISKEVVETVYRQSKI